MRSRGPQQRPCLRHFHGLCWCPPHLRCSGAPYLGVRLLHAMNYRRAVREAMRQFPSQLQITHQSPDSSAKPHSPVLVQAWGRAEEWASKQSDWHHIAVWAVGCALHRLVKEQAEMGEMSVEKTQICRRYMEHKFAESLLTPNHWFPRHIKRAYRRDRLLRGLPPFPERTRSA